MLYIVLSFSSATSQSKSNDDQVKLGLTQNWPKMIAIIRKTI